MACEPGAPSTGVADGRHTVLLVSDSYPPLIGGATWAVRQLAQDLARNGYEVTVVTAWQLGSPSHERDGSVQVLRIRDLGSRLRFLSSDRTRHTPPPFPDPEATWRLRSVVRSVKPGVVYAYGWLAHSCALALWRTRVPLILSARDHGNVCALRTFVHRDGPCSGPALGKCLRCSSKEYGWIKAVVGVVSVRLSSALLRRRVTALQSCSRYLQGVIRTHLFRGRWNLEARGLVDVVVPDYRTASGLADPGCATLALLPGEPYILFVGALRRIKGLEPLLVAYRQLDDPPPLVLIGPRAPDTPRTFPPGVVVVPPATKAEVMAAWEGALFGVAPSILPEPLGNVVHEAMACGKPVIGTRPGGHEDMIRHGVDGLLVPSNDAAALADAMRYLIDDGVARRRMGRAAIDAAARFTSEAVLPAYLELFRQGPSRMRGSAS